MANKVRNKPENSLRNSDIAQEDKSRFLLQIQRTDISKEQQIAELALNPTIPNASTALDYSRGLFPDLSLQECVNVMEADIQTVNAGNLDKLEGTLTAQAKTLNAIFNTFAKRAIYATHLSQLDTYTRLAMKAQSQCRTTIEAIVEIKHPKSATFIKQANIARQQQVNNGDARSNETSTRAHAHEKTINPTNELLTESTHETVDARGTTAASGVNSQLEAVGAVDWPD